MTERADSCPPGASVKFCDHPNLLVERLSNHSCVVSHLVDHAWLIDGHDATALEIAARGRIT